MFQRLRQKWAVSGWRLLLILCTFAIGGSLSGWAARKVLGLLEIDQRALWLLVYIVAVTLIWPLSVLLVSIPFGQFGFFRKYLARLGSRMAGRKPASSPAARRPEEPGQNATLRHSKTATMD